MSDDKPNRFTNPATNPMIREKDDLDFRSEEEVAADAERFGDHRVPMDPRGDEVERLAAKLLGTSEEFVDQATGIFVGRDSAGAIRVNLKPVSEVDDGLLEKLRRLKVPGSTD